MPPVYFIAVLVVAVGSVCFADEGVATRPELNIHLKLPIIQFCYSYKLTLLFKPFLPIIQVI